MSRPSPPVASPSIEIDKSKEIRDFLRKIGEQWHELTSANTPSLQRKQTYIHTLQNLITFRSSLRQNLSPAENFQEETYRQLARQFLIEDRKLFHSIFWNLIDNLPLPSNQIELTIPQHAQKYFHNSLPLLVPEDLDRKAEAIRTSGFYVWKNFVADALEQEALHAGVKKTIGNMKTFLHTLLPRISRNEIKKDTYLTYDEELHCKHWFSVKDDPNDHLFLRIRSRYDFGSNPSIDKLHFIMHHPIIWTLAARYFKHSPTLEYLLCEELNPNPQYRYASENPALAENWFDENDGWHVDSAYQRLKVFIFLTDVKPENGPMRVRARSNTFVQSGWGNLIHNLFCNGRSSGYPTQRQMQEIAFLETQLITGNAGDLVIFDPYMVHSTTPCLTDQRLILAHSFIADSPANSFLEYLSQDLVI